MKNKFITTLVLLFVGAVQAQVGVGTTTPEPSSALDVTSTTQGFLPPRMTYGQLTSITAPAEGLMVFCTDCTPKGLYVYDSSAWLQLSTVIPGSPSANGSAVVSSYSCSTATAGTMTVGTPVSGVTQTITATVTTVGTYSISTAANGVTFAATGTFAGTGAQNIVLTATGTPASVGSATFVLNTTPNCSFTRTTLVSPSSNGAAVVSSYSCTTATAGTMAVGTAVSGVTQTITATVTTAGTYSINATANGVTFAGSGTFAGTGAQNIVLTATGTPTTAGSIAFTLNTSPNCSFSRTIAAAAPTVCTVKISATENKNFLCHNLGADTSLDSHTPVMGLQGAYILWGFRGPNTTGDSRVDWQTAANTSNFAAAPTAANSGNAGAISGWINAFSNDSWDATNPCPTGYRVPTSDEWTAVNTYNTASRTGTFTAGATTYGAALHYGPDASTKSLTLPATGYRSNADGALISRGELGYYWSSSVSGAGGALNLSFTSSNVTIISSSRALGLSIRCIAE